ncbi:hypothetical protein INR49_011163 [Caranx melampygus]|nr:hypothetical protein INR49_011163 [Caranx melampygus]
MFCPIRAGGTLVGWVSWAGTAEPTALDGVMFFSVGWSRHPVASLRGRRRKFFSVFFSLTLCLLPSYRNNSLKMTTTTTFQGMDPGAKSSSRVLRPPGGDSSFTFGTDDNTTPQRKNKMASSIFAEPEDPHAHRRNNPPTGTPTGTLCGEPSAPLRRCQQPLLFPKNPQPELTTIHNSGAAMIWNQRREVENGQEQANDAVECPENVEVEQEEQEQQETSESSAPSGGANAAAGGRRNPPGGKSSLILG